MNDDNEHHLSVAKLLNPQNKALAPILRKISQLKQWNTWLSDCLPQEKDMLKHCHIVRYEHQQLYIVSDSAQWVMRLRFYIPELIPKLNKISVFKELKSIDCKVRPDTSKKFSSDSSLQSTPISAKSAEILKNILKTLNNGREIPD